MRRETCLVTAQWARNLASTVFPPVKAIPAAVRIRGGRRAVRAGLPEHVQHLRELRRPDVVHAGPERDIVAEQLRQLERLPRTDQGQQGHPISLGTLLLLEAEVIGEPQRDETGAQHVLHRLAERQVGREGEGGHQLRESHPR
jgi:hypothetical protein